MSMTLDRPPTEAPESRPQPQPRLGDEPEARVSPTRTGPERAMDARPAGMRPRRGLLQRYQQHLWIGAVSLAVIAAALGPIAVGYMSRPAATNASAPQSATIAPSNLATSVNITAVG